MTSTWRRLLRSPLALLVAGVIVLQAVWVLAVPPFRGSDEFDHAYRAAGVASGQWRLDEHAPDGRQILVDVPDSLVDAARAQCERLPYTSAVNCTGSATGVPGQVAVATGAATYDPLFYWVTGTVSQAFHGATALYAMRITAALMCLALLVLSGAVLLSQRPGRWERMGLVLSLTPVLVFSTAIAAPNGLEMCAGLLVWVSGLGLVGGRRPDLERRYVGAAVTGAVVLGFLRMLGPVWLACTVLVLLLYAGRGPLRRLWRRHRGALSAGALGVVLSVAGGAAWVLSAGGTTSTGVVKQVDGYAVQLLLQTFVWVPQTVAAFPYRDQFAPMAVYPMVLIPVIAALVLAVKRGSRRQRVAVLVAVGLALLVPLAISALTVHSQGLIWQGRYALPFIVGVLVLAGRVLDDTDWAPVEGPRLAAIALVLVGAAWVVCVHAVVTRELASAASTARSGWVHPSVWVLDAVCVLGFACLALFAVRSPGPVALHAAVAAHHDPLARTPAQ